MDGVRQLDAALAALLAADLPALSGIELADALAAIEQRRRQLDAVDARLIAELDERGVSGEFGRTSTEDLVAIRCRVDPREAKARVMRARSLGPRRSVSGEPLAPLLPATSAALSAGDVSAAQVQVIAETMDAVDDLPCAAEAAGPAEALLVSAAAHEAPRALRRTSTMLLQRLDPDGRLADDARSERLRQVTVTGRRLSGTLTDETAAVWRTIIDALSAPQPGDDGTRDDRAPRQRRHDAFLEAGLRLLRSGSLPDCGGTPVTVLITTTAEQWNDPAGLARTEHGELVSMTRLRGMADELGYALVTLSPKGEVLAFGRDRRLANPSLRRALAGRDGGCCFPGCTRPPAWCQAHHVGAWLHGGTTDIGNLCLVCTHHHRLLERGDWQVRMSDGVPEWIPPPWLDPLRRPLRNTAHHLPVIDFACPDDG